MWFTQETSPRMNYEWIEQIIASICLQSQENVRPDLKQTAPNTIQIL